MSDDIVGTGEHAELEIDGAILEVASVEGQEALSRLFRYEVLCTLGDGGVIPVPSASACEARVRVMREAAEAARECVAGVSSSVVVGQTGEEELHERDVEGERPPEERTPVPDASRWEPWWKEHRQRFDPEAKYRFGQPFSPRLTLEELSGDDAGFTERTTGMLEISILAGGSQLDAHDWVGRQREQIAVLAEQLRAAGRMS